jgi:SAM-dependent methyltransferase
MSQFWDQRYSGTDYAYGKEPNDFLVAEASRIPRGKVLCLAEGEGRNAVYLASLGHAVTAVDFSQEGVRKTQALAKERGAKVTSVHQDVMEYDLGTACCQGIVAIFAHFFRSDRRTLAAHIVKALAPRGVLIMESYRPEQIQYDTGGPKDLDLLPTVDELKQEFRALDLVILRNADRKIHEGRFHDGLSATVQLVGIKHG